MKNDDYLIHVAKILKQENVEPHLQQQILATVAELFTYYSVDYVRKLLLSLFET